ncbi:glycerophosphodiester phosphodiesterase [Lentibacillus halophilus]|uniref:Glycerophosphodiester phosphodiesterase n=1 Tax=Lentibacillus halophilus TaxID=295065 RepID=A0ABP3J6K8_9BACI
MPTTIFAHRGASSLAPENTMPSFKLAYELGAEGIETDVHLTRDNETVLMHDEHLKRTTNGHGYIKNFTYEQLQKLDAGSWFSSDYAGVSILTLGTLLNWVRNKSLYLNLELKNNKIDYKYLEHLVYEQVKQYRLTNRTILSTSNPHSIKRLRLLSDSPNIGFLRSKRAKNLVGYTEKLGAGSLHINHRLLSPRLLRQSDEANMPLRVYTVNRPDIMRRCFQSGCDAIITDVPHTALEQRK